MASFFTNHEYYFIFLNLRVHDGLVTDFMTEWRAVNWSMNYLGIQRLDARSPVGRHFLIVNSVVPYLCCLTDSFNLYFSL